MALISILQDDNDRTYALSRSDSVELNTALDSGFKVRFIKTSSASYPSSITSTLGIRGQDNTLSSVSEIILAHPNDTVELMYDDVNNCFQITEHRRADLPAVVDDIKERAAFKDEVNLFTAGQAIKPIRIIADDLQNGEQITIDAAVSNNVHITAGNTSHTIYQPSNLADGMTMNFVINHTQSEGGSISFGSGFMWANGGEPPQLTESNGTTDIVSCYYVQTGDNESEGTLMCSVAYNICPLPA